MADGSRWLDLGQELVVDLFAGGGGASLGIARAYRAPDVAVNHNPIAIAVHRANHPETDHHIADVFEVDPLSADDATLRDRYGKYVADLVVCALRIANTFPGGVLDLQAAVQDRIFQKNLAPQTDGA